MLSIDSSITNSEELLRSLQSEAIAIASGLNSRLEWLEDNNDSDVDQESEQGNDDKSVEVFSEVLLAAEMIVDDDVELFASEELQIMHRMDLHKQKMEDLKSVESELDGLSIFARVMLGRDAELILSPLKASGISVSSVDVVENISPPIMLPSIERGQAAGLPSFA